MNPEKLFAIEIVSQHPGPAELAEILPFKVRLRFIPTVLAQSATSYPDCPGRVWDVADSPGLSVVLPTLRDARDFGPTVLGLSGD